MIEIAVLASSLVSSFLLPLLKDGVETLRSKLSERAGEEAADKLVDTAGRVWDQIRSAPRTPETQDVVSMFERSPELMREAMEKVVSAELENNDALRREVSSLLEAEAAPGQTSWQLMGEIVGATDARYAHIGDHAVVAGVVVDRQRGGTAQEQRPPGG